MRKILLPYGSSCVFPYAYGLFSNCIENRHEIGHDVGVEKYGLVSLDLRISPYGRTPRLEDIKDRIQFAFRPRAIKDDLLRIISGMAGGDVRIALQILLRAGKKAEDKRLKQITMEEIKKAAREARTFKKSYLLRKLNEDQRVIYGILERKKKLASGALYREYRSLVSNPVVARAYRNYIKRIVGLGLVRVEGKGRWKSYEIII